MKLIARPIYLDHIISLLNRGMMLFLIGQRRVGKSYMLLQLKEWLETNNSDASVLYINKELLQHRDIADAQQLYDKAVSQFGTKSTNNYLLVDEIQDIADYEVALRSLYAEERCQIVATGSNAMVFSSELSTKISGRYIEIPIYSLTYIEFLKFHALDNNDDSLQRYLQIGGLPGLSLFDINDNRHIQDYVQGVYNTIMYKDVVERNNIRNVPFINNIISFIADNEGKLMSIKNIANTLKANFGKYSASEVTTSTYIEHLTKALLINPVYRYNIHERKLLENNYKYYFTDHGIRNFLTGYDLAQSIEKVIENVVYNQLRVWGYDVTVGTLKQAEIDFVATRGAERCYIQCTYIMRNDETVAREFGNLAAIRDNYPKYIISLEPITGELTDYPGIRHIHLRQFLTSGF